MRRVFSDPVEVVQAARTEQVLPALRRIEEAVAAGRSAAGYLAYEAAPAFDEAFRVRSGNRLPLLWFGIFEGDGDPRPSPPGTAVDPSRDTTDPSAPPPGEWRLEVDRATYDRAIRRIRDAIREGRTYQVNYTARMKAPFRGDASRLYERLRGAQGPGYHALLDLGRHAVVSASPELFFHLAGRDLVTRPMKGTRPRGRWKEEDDVLARELRRSEKDRAENRMIVDLLRNDLGRVAEIGSVRVPELFEVERYRTVLQMTSTVAGRLGEGRGLVDVFEALFPCGSVTGAPKVRTMALIAALERSPREVYCGAVGFADGTTGHATFNVPIRTLWLDRSEGAARYGAGGGVTWDSTADAEHDELRSKTRVLTESWPDFDLLETMRLEDGRLLRLERHLDRIRGSAAYFGRPFPEARVRQRLQSVAEAHPTGRHRVRWTLDEGGSVEITVRRLDPDEEGSAGENAPGEGGPGEDRDDSFAGRRAAGEERELRPVALADTPVDPDDRFLFHKTTLRSPYRAHRSAHPDAFEVLLWNPRGEATEFTRGNLVVEREGRRVTPPRSAGLLAGCFRAELLESDRVVEAPVPLEELRSATRLWMVNSVRGWVEVRLV